MKTHHTVVLCFVLLLAIIFFSLPAVQAVRARNRMTVSQNNLKQIGMGLWSYHDAYASMPLGADIGGDGQPHHGWQIRLLPFLEATPLYSMVNFKYAWNDPFNAPCFRFHVPVWLIPGIKRVTDDEGFALSHYAGSSHVFGIDHGASLGKMRGGASQTILAGEVAAGFSPWGRPGNCRDPIAGLRGDENTFGSEHPAGIQFVMGDGSVRVIDRNVDPQVLKALATPADDERSGDE